MFPTHNHLIANTPATRYARNILSYAAARKVATGTVVFTAKDFRKRDTGDDALDFLRRAVALTFDDLPGEDDVFKVEDREVVIFKFFTRV